MSLVGSLEDLSLGDILQIISLSQKSGVLCLETNGADGRIVFVSGLVRGAAIKGGPHDLRGVLVDGGFLAEQEFDAALEHARQSGGSPMSAVAATTSISAERIDSLCRESIEAAVVTMFGWMTGDFSFDVRSEPAPSDPELLLPTGINAQYLAMEGARVSDESGSSDESSCVESAPPVAADPDAGFDEMSAHELFGVSSDEEPEGAAPEQAAVELLASATLQRCDDEALLLEDEEPGSPILEVAEQDDLADAILEPEAALSTELVAAELSDALPEVVPHVVLDAEPVALEWPEPAAGPLVQSDDGGKLEAESTQAPDTSTSVAADDRALVVIDSDLPVLEWVKQAASDDFVQVHIFQHTDQALARIRQYLVRGEPPIVLISPDAVVDETGGILDVNDFIVRLKGQSPRLMVMWLCEEGSDLLPSLGPADASITRPQRRWLRVDRTPEADQEAATDFLRRLQIDIAATTSDAGKPAGIATEAISPDAIRRLRDATRSLTEASSRGEVLPLVIRFASEIFGRVAMFMVLEDLIVGMAQNGMERAGGPDDAGLRQIRLSSVDSPWMQSVLDDKKPVHSSPDSDADRALFSFLGECAPSAAYLAPIESTGQVIALLYGDNLPEDGPIGDTSALEVVLHHAGLALDRAALERALREDAAS